MNEKQLKRTIEEITSDLTLVEFFNKHTQEKLYFGIENKYQDDFLFNFKKIKGEFLSAPVDLLETLSFSIEEKELNDNALIKGHKDYISKETRLFILLLKNQMELKRIPLIPMGITKPTDPFFATLEIKL